MTSFQYAWKTVEFSHRFTEGGWRSFWGILLGLSLWYALATDDFLFALILVISLLLIAWQQFAKPRPADISLSQDAVSVNGSSRPLSDFSAFTTHQTDVRTVLYFIPKDRFSHAFHFPIGDGVDLRKLEEDLSTVLPKEGKVAFADRLYRALFP